MEERRCDLPIISDSQKCNCTGKILWHKALVLEPNNEPKRTYGHLVYLKIFQGVIPLDPNIKVIKLGDSRETATEGQQEVKGKY
jgi:hypothetical protein